MKKAILELLEKVNDRDGNLMIGLNLKEYVDKIHNKAKIISIQQEGKLLGFIAYYDNALDKKEAYLTMLAVDKEFQGKGYGKWLLGSSIKFLKDQGFLKYKLQVATNEIRAIHLYTSYGFKLDKKNNDTQFMIKEL